MGKNSLSSHARAFERPIAGPHHDMAVGAERLAALHLHAPSPRSCNLSQPSREGWDMAVWAQLLPELWSWASGNTVLLSCEVSCLAKCAGSCGGKRDSTQIPSPCSRLHPRRPPMGVFLLLPWACPCLRAWRRGLWVFPGIGLLPHC